MVGVLASCNALEPIFEQAVSGDIEPKETMSEFSIIEVKLDVETQDSMSESSTVIVV